MRDRCAVVAYDPLAILDADSVLGDSHKTLKMTPAMAAGVSARL